MTPNVKINLHGHKNFKGNVTILQDNLILLMRNSNIRFLRQYFLPQMEGPFCRHLGKKQNQLYESSQSQDRHYSIKVCFC